MITILHDDTLLDLVAVAVAWWVMERVTPLVIQPIQLLDLVMSYRSFGVRLVVEESNNGYCCCWCPPSLEEGSFGKPLSFFMYAFVCVCVCVFVCFFVSMCAMCVDF